MKPNQLKPKFVIVGFKGDTVRTYGTNSGRTLHGETAAEATKTILQKMRPDWKFITLEVLPYLLAE